MVLSELDAMLRFEGTTMSKVAEQLCTQPELMRLPDEEIAAELLIPADVWRRLRGDASFLQLLWKQALVLQGYSPRQIIAEINTLNAIASDAEKPMPALAAQKLKAILSGNYQPGVSNAPTLQININYPTVPAIGEEVIDAQFRPESGEAGA